jgi:hypothetical protein
VEDGRLELVEGLRGEGLGFVVSRYGDVDDAAGGDVWGEENRGEFNLYLGLSMEA